ncbi:MAG: NUDIX domain-containing protein [Candidatus Peregrinibacteria bacterium]|nr:NUDIX domain-containing protein [Candidatus Peregrinibacteria bacterium]
MQQFDEKSCGLVVFRKENNENLFLVLKYPGGHFDFPKGHIEDRDSSERATALRELEEETGITSVKFIDTYREEISYNYNRKNTPSNKQVIFFLAETEEKDVKISHEHTNYYWLPYDIAFEKLTFDNAKNLLKKAKSLL